MKHNGWTPIEEDKMPEHEITVLVWTNYGARMAVRDGDGFRLYGLGKESAFMEMFKATHWRYLPEPPANFETFE